MTLASAALSLCASGWPVFPCERNGKRPLVAGGFKAATTDAAQVRGWWRQWPEANVGYPTGSLVVVEIDGPEGMRARREQEAQRLDWPVTLTTISGRDGGGAHFYYRPAVRIRNAAGVRNGRGIGPGIDVRGDGGYVVLPPSIHETGRPYRWAVRMDPAPLPSWMAERLKPPEPMVRPEHGAVSSGYLKAALEGEIRELEDTPEGQLNDQLNRAAFKLGMIVVRADDGEDEVRDALLAVAVSLGHPSRSAERTIVSGLRSGMAKA